MRNVKRLPRPGEKQQSVFSKMGIEISLLILIVIASFMSPKFLTVNNIINVLRQVSVTGVIAVGMTIAIINGGIDISVCGIVGLSGMVALLLQPYGTAVAILAALGIGIVCGLLNGFFISRGLAPFIVTLASDTVIRGLAYITTNGQPVSGVTDAYRWLGAGYVFSWTTADGKTMGLPTPVLIFLLTLALAYFMMTRTQFGRRVYAVGGNAEAARLSGISVVKTKMIVYAISGSMAALSAIMLTARMASCDPTLGTGYNVDAISASVIGGASMAGGEGNVVKTLFGALIITILSNVLNMRGVSTYWQQVVTGMIILITVFVDNEKRKKE